LAAHAHLLEKFGGHAMASGLSLSPDRLNELESGLQAHLHTHYTPADFSKTLTIDAVLDPTDICLDLARDLDRLRPFGTDNPEPLFLAKRLHVISSTIIGRSHRKMLLQSADTPGGPTLEAFHFNVPDPLQTPGFYDQLIFRLKLSKFKTDTPQMIVEQA
jgi:single-stranded-DNA-specific exonuclease